MTNFEITLFSVAILMAVVWWLSKPYRCKKCNTIMIDFYDEETGQTWKVCPNCMHKELIGEEDGN
jgi:DNA-directed RNA polymerase subunit RPC12/RpoP